MPDRPNQPNNPSSLSRVQLRQMLEQTMRKLAQSNAVVKDQLQQIIVHCMSAHFRNGECTAKQAAKVIGCSEDNFRLLQATVDEEARRFLMECEQGPPNG